MYALCTSNLGPISTGSIGWLVSTDIDLKEFEIDFRIYRKENEF